MSADAVIVIFGAAVLAGGRASTTLVLRVEAAVAFAAGRKAPLFVPTGGVGRFAPAEASVMSDLLVARGVPRARILAEPTGTDTLSSVLAVARLLRAQRIAAPVFVATSFYHLPRCLVLLRVFGVRARAALPPVVPAGLHWWRRCRWWAREALALPYDLGIALVLRALGRW